MATSTPPPPSRTLSGEKDDSLLFRQCCSRAFKLASQAVDLDEASTDADTAQKKRALELYRLACSSMGQALEIKLPTRGEEAGKLKSTRERVERNLSFASERVDTLTKLIKSSVEPVIPWRATAPAAQASKPAVVLRLPRSRTKPSTPSTGSKPAATATGRPKAATKATTPTGKTANEKRDGVVSSLKGVDAKLANTILDEVLDQDSGVEMSDVIGLDKAKAVLYETVVQPNLRPELFHGLRAPAKGLLLFGPPGNGKTMLAKAVAHEAGCTFFNISASSLVSKWVGESEKLVRALFAMARELQPSIIFIDEIDSILTSRSDKEQESSRRLKTELLVQFDGVGSSQDDRILVMGATNTPHLLDDAAIRRLPTRIYVTMPDARMREGIMRKLMKKVDSSISDGEYALLGRKTEGYSCSDTANLCKDAAMGPIRELGAAVADVDIADVRPVMAQDFLKSMERVRKSLSAQSVEVFDEWNRDFGYS
eukprot:m.48441 g.48441  ORF g.48441 m.48441 type:complete len:483 (+) comp11038_c0_seq3:166-1614(+)